MVRLKGWRSEYLEFEVNEKYVIESVIDMLRKKHKLEDVDKLDEKGRMCEYVEYATSHSWIKKEDRGEPTAQQKKVLEIIEELKTLP